MVCFAEPDAHDLASPAEAMGEYLAYDDSDAARRLRAALNDLLAAMPSDIAAAFCHRLRVESFRRVWFELFVGRFLQLAGAIELVHGPVGINGKSPDWQATFPGDQVVYVEATSPDPREDWAASRANHEPLLVILDRLMPPGWGYVVNDLPDHGPDDRRTGYQAVLRQMLANVPPAATSSATLEAPLHIHGDTDLGPVDLDLVPIRQGRSPFMWGPTYGGMGHSVEVIADAVRGKRPQGRAFPGRVLIAIDGAPGTDVESYETALYGSRVDLFDRASRQIVPDIRFDATGALTRQTRPEFPGVLGFHGLTLLGNGPDPILYVHPRFDGDLPDELTGLERRVFDGRRITLVAAKRPAILRRW
jgi:hypothetical protein